jgi:hypothetical protein
MGMLIALLFIFAIDYYAFQGVKMYFAPGISDTNRLLISGTYWLLSAIIPVLFILGFIELRKHDHTPYIMVLTGNVWFIILSWFYLEKIFFDFFLVYTSNFSMLALRLWLRTHLSCLPEENL